MKKFVIAAFAIAVMVGCHKTVIESQDGQDLGYITLDLSSDTEMKVVTKGDDAEVDFSSYNVALYAGDQNVWTKEYSEITQDDCILKAGNYRIAVENMTDSEAAPETGKGDIRLAGVADVVVRSGIITPVTIHCTPANSRVTVAYDDKFAQVFSDPELIITGGERSLNMLWGHESEKGAYFPGKTTLSWKLTATLSSDSSVTKTYVSNSETPYTTFSGKWIQITFSASTSDGSINVKITIDDEFEEVEEVLETIDPFENN